MLEHHPDIALMFTDVVRPQVNGAKLAQEALRMRPALKIVFTTGYTRNAVVHHGVLDAGVELIGKPSTDRGSGGEDAQRAGWHLGLPSSASPPKA